MASALLGNGISSTGTFYTDPTKTTKMDPTVVSVTVGISGLPGETFTYGTDEEVSKTATGVYKLLYLPDAPGTWVVRWNSSGGVAETAAGEDTIEITSSRLP